MGARRGCYAPLDRIKGSIVDEQAFTAYMQQRKKTPATQARYLDHLRAFESFLTEQRGTYIEAATGDDVHAFVDWVEGGGKATRLLRKALWGLWTYAEWTDNESLFLAVMQRLGDQAVRDIRLREYPDIDPAQVERLADLGIRSAADLLAAGRTSADRAALCQQANINPAVLLRMLQYADLLRLPGTKMLRVQMIHTAGYVSLDRIAACPDVSTFLADVNRVIAGSESAKLGLGDKEGHVILQLARHFPPLVEWPQRAG